MAVVVGSDGADVMYIFSIISFFSRFKLRLRVKRTTYRFFNDVILLYLFTVHTDVTRDSAGAMQMEKFRVVSLCFVSLKRLFSEILISFFKRSTIYINVRELDVKRY